jgi:hypothetical protein
VRHAALRGSIESERLLVLCLLCLPVGPLLYGGHAGLFMHGVRNGVKKSVVKCYLLFSQSTFAVVWLRLDAQLSHDLILFLGKALVVGLKVIVVF